MEIDTPQASKPLLPDPMDVANLTQDGVLQFLIDCGYPATRHMVKWAFLRRELKPVRLGNCNYVSRRDVLNWVESRRQQGNYVAPDNGKSIHAKDKPAQR